MRGGRVAKFGLCFALAICIGIFFADYAHRSAIRSVQQRRDALETEFKNRLPAGTDRFHVLAILDEKGIPQRVRGSKRSVGRICPWRSRCDRGASSCKHVFSYAVVHPLRFSI